MLPTARVNYVMNTNLIVNSALQAEGRKKRAVDDGKEKRREEASRSLLLSDLPPSPSRS